MKKSRAKRRIYYRVLRRNRGYSYARSLAKRMARAGAKRILVRRRK